MSKNRRSFFERLTGSVSAKNEEEEEEARESVPGRGKMQPQQQPEAKATDWMTEEEEGQLAVDVAQTPSDIIIQAVVAGVKPDELDVAITQDMITIHGKRQRQREISGEDYYYQELYWGGFSRSIMLPQEVDAESAEATLKNGLLTIKLPKLDKNRVQKVKVKNE